MHVAVLSDIHGNLAALEAVLAEVREAGADELVVTGDLFPGPFMRECLAALSSASTRLPCRFLRGNGENDVLASRAGREIARVPEFFRDAIVWNARGIDDAQAATLGAWPLTTRLDLPAFGRILFCHATPRDDNEIFTRLTPAERLRPIFEAAGADVVVCGHTHMTFDRQVGTVRVVNAGSVGMPFGRTGADWLLLGDGGEIRFRHTGYDLETAAAAIRATAYPQAEFAAEAVVAPRSEAEMTALFERAAARLSS